MQAKKLLPGPFRASLYVELIGKLFKHASWTEMFWKSNETQHTKLICNTAFKVANSLTLTALTALV
jgi:hypothetical protein